MTGIAVLVTGVLTTGVLAGCGPEPVPEPAETPSTSPVDARPRADPQVSSLSAVLVSPREPAVPFAGSDGRVTVTYELGVHNPTPFALTLTTAEVLDPSGRVLQKLEQPAVAANLALPSVRSGVKQLTEGAGRHLVRHPAVPRPLRRAGAAGQPDHGCRPSGRRALHERVDGGTDLRRSNHRCSAPRSRPARATSPPTAAATRSATAGHCSRWPTASGSPNASRSIGSNWTGRGGR